MTREWLNLSAADLLRFKQLFAYWVILHAFLSSADFFSKSTFLKNSFRNLFRVSNSLDPDQARQTSGLLWVQAVCKRYQQTTREGKELNERWADSEIMTLVSRAWMCTFFF